jgi:hypothetical protein
MVLSDAQRRLRRSKQSERDLGKFLLAYNGPDPFYSLISSSTGRVGHITELQFDVVSIDYAAENKNVRLPKRLMVWWDQIVDIAAKHKKQPLLRIDPTNEGKHQELHIITADRHRALLEIEKLWREGAL